MEDVATEEVAEVESHEPVSLGELFDVSPNQEVSPSVETSPESETEEAKAETEKVETPSLEKPVISEKEQYEQRLKETRDWTSRVNAENAQLKRDFAEQAAYLAMINKKLDGNWTEEDDRAMQAPQTTPDEAMQYGHTEGKIAASRDAAYQIFGRENVEKTLFADDAPFRAIMDDPIVNQKVLSSNAPVIEAMKIVQVKQFYDKWGYEPKDIEKNMRESIEKELTDKITQKVIKQLNGRDRVSTGIRDVKGIDIAKDVGYSQPSTKELFG